MQTHQLETHDENDRRAFRNALGRYATGVTVVMAGGGGHDPVGITVNSFASVSLDPPLILWSVERDSTGVHTFTHAPDFTVSVLGADQGEVAMQFADSKTEAADRLSGAPLESGPGPVPLIAGAPAWFHCRLEATFPGGDHTVILGRVTAFSYSDGPTLLFHDGAFARSE